MIACFSLEKPHPRRETTGQELEKCADSQATIRLLAVVSLPARAGQGIFDGIGYGFRMHLAGKMNGAPAINGIPAGGVGGTEKLGLYAHFPGRIFYRRADEPPAGLPGSGTGGSAHHPHIRYLAIPDLDLVFRGAETIAIFTQANLPGKTASGGRGKHPLAGHLFARGDDGYLSGMTERNQIIGEIWVFQEIEHQVGVNFLRKIPAGILNDVRQRLIYGDHRKLNRASSVLTNTGNLFLTAAMLLKNDDLLHGFIRFHLVSHVCSPYLRYQDEPTGYSTCWLSQVFFDDPGVHA